MEPKLHHAWLMGAIQTLVNAGIIIDAIKYVSSIQRPQKLQSKARNSGSASNAAGKGGRNNLML